MAKKNTINLERQLKKRKKKTNSSYFDADLQSYIGYNQNSEPVCTISKVREENLEQIRQCQVEGLKIGDWFVSSGECSNLKISGPYQTINAAMSVCSENFDIASFHSMPQNL